MKAMTMLNPLKKFIKFLNDFCAIGCLNKFNQTEKNAPVLGKIRNIHVQKLKLSSLKA